MEITISRSVPEEYREKAVLLFEQAFGEKISVAVNNKEQRLDLFSRSFDLNFALAAISDGQLVGIAGFSIDGKSLTSKLEYADLIKTLGIVKGNWAALILSMFKRNANPNQLLMDGISVYENFRGQGIGKKLLNALISFAKESGFKSIRLDVINTNPRAKKLYEKSRFYEIKNDKYPYLKWLLGFSGSDELRYIIE
jgi:ribosomal protein S18 acetylase RimI-like enzyme